MNLYGDLNTSIRSWFNSMDIIVPDTHPISDLLERFINVHAKLIRPQHRVVYISNEITDKILPAPYPSIFEEMVRKFRQGEDMTSYLSRQSLMAEKDDGMLNDWGLHHLHISNVKEHPQHRFFARSDYLLFVRVEPDRAFLIDIRPHSEPDLFAKQEVLTIIKRNWNELLEPYRIKDIQPSVSFTDTQKRKLRNAGICTFMEIDGEGYAPMGLGITAAGSGLRQRITSDRILGSLHEIEEHLKGHVWPRLLKDCRPPEYCDFKLKIEGYRFVITLHPGDSVCYEIPF